MNIGNAPLDERSDFEWRQCNGSDEGIGDSSPCGYSSPKVAQQQDVEVISIEERGNEPNTLLPLGASICRPYSQMIKRQAEKNVLNPPSKKQYLGSKMKGSSSQVLDKPSDPLRSMTHMAQVHSSSPFSSSQANISSATHVAKMPAQFLTALTLAPTSTPIGPFFAPPQVQPYFKPQSLCPQLFLLRCRKRPPSHAGLVLESLLLPQMLEQHLLILFSQEPLLSFHYFLLRSCRTLSGPLLMALFPNFPLQSPLVLHLQVKLLQTQMPSSNKLLIPNPLVLAKRLKEKKRKVHEQPARTCKLISMRKNIVCSLQLGSSRSINQSKK